MNLSDFIDQPGEWLSSGGPMNDVVVSSRIRLARNLAGHRFLGKAGPDERAQIERSIADAIVASDLGTKTTYIDIEKSDPLDREFLVERHLISKQHADGNGKRGVAISDEETLAMMINEEDHLRIQVLRRGMNLDNAWEQIDRVDATLGSMIDFACHEQFGYLTACPTNVGTGLRVSVMLHLPALKLTNEIEKVFRAAKEMRLAVRGLFGEGTDATGDFFQVSNQVTLGESEEQILDAFKSEVIPAVVKYEQEARKALINEKTTALDDKVWRAWGILSNARALSSEETLFLLSHLRMGVVLERISHIDLATINELFITAQSAHLQKRHGAILTGEQRSIARADYIRTKLQKPSSN